MPWSLAERLSKRPVVDPSEWLLRGYRALCALPLLAPVLVGVFTVAYFAATCDRASLKPFRDDELSTYEIAVMPTAGDVWRAWLESPDGLPPVTHLSAHFLGSALGFSHVTVRLPDIVGFWLMCVCIFVFLSRRVCPLLAAVGMLLPVTVPAAYFYAYEARGYGMVLAFSGAAVVCWDLAPHTGWRRVALLGLPASLGAAIATHPYAVLMVVPLALAELARTVERRRVDWLVWMGLVVVGVLLLPANPVMSRMRRLSWVVEYSVGHRVSVPQLMELALQFLSIPATYVGLLALVCIGRQSRPGRLTSPTTREGRLPLSDWVLVIGLMALPALGWLLAYLVTGAVLFRYVIAAVIGFSLGITFLCWVAVRRRPEIALLLAAWVAVTAAGSAIAARYVQRTTLTTAHVAAGRGCFRLLKLWEQLPPDGLPIVVSEFYYFSQIHHYASEALKQRLVFLTDQGRFGAEIEGRAPFYAKVCGEHIEGLEQFVRSHRSFYLYDCGGPGKLPIIERLLGAGASLRDSGLPETTDILLRHELYRVSMPGGATDGELRR